MTTVRQDGAGRVRPVWQHAFFATWLVVASAGPLTDRATSGAGLLLPLALIAALAAWYALWMVRDSALSGRATAV